MGELFEQIMAGEYDYPEEYWDEVSDEGKNFKEILNFQKKKKKSQQVLLKLFYSNISKRFYR